jgi:hypothetical protein
MKNRKHASLICALSIGLLAAAAGCETRERSLGTTASLKCQQLPACQFQCPDGTANPVDGDGCTHTCECTLPPAGTGMSDGATVSCPTVPQCQFQCPDGTQNPVDVQGCAHTCECVRHGDVCVNEPACGSSCPPGTVTPVDRNGCITSCKCPPADAGVQGPKLYFTCGDPSCSGYRGGSGQPLCTTQREGDACTVDGQTCDPQNFCNQLLVCASSDPTLFPNRCPKSRRRYKNDIHYLAPAELARYREELMAMKLATWRYKHDPAKEHLGFIIDDNEDLAAVDANRDVVDLYGYTSMAVATIQLQARQIEALEREVAAMKKQRPTSPAPRPTHVNDR